MLLSSPVLLPTATILAYLPSHFLNTTRRHVRGLLHSIVIHQHPTGIMPMRPTSDKEVDVVDLDRLFEEYVQTDLLNHFGDCNPKQSSSGEPKHLFDSVLSNESQLFGSEPILDRETQAAWHKALEKYEQNPTPSRAEDSISSSYVTSSTGNESFSDSELLNLDDFFELERKQSRSISQPPTTRPHTSGRSVKKAVSIYNQLRHRDISKTSKRLHASTFTKMMQSSQHQPSAGNTWTRKTDSPTNSFTGASSHGIASPPLSTKAKSNEFFVQGHYQTYADNYSNLPNNGSGFLNYQLTPCASPAIGTPSISGSGFDNDTGLTSSSSSAPSAALSALQTPPSSLQLSMTTWGPNTSSALDVGFSASCDSTDGTQTTGWWDGNVSASHPLHSTSFSQSNSLSTSQNMRSEGLGISCGSAPYGFGTMHDGFSASRTSAAFDMVNYGVMYNTPSHQQQHHHAQHHVAPISQSVSRSPSPRAETRFHRSSHASSHRTSQSSMRRKSSNTSQQSSRQMSTSNGGVGFVNFTPDDSRKILTGVAPSGSSKTKARREKEAADKRRKLSRAAVKAVIEAGGDIDSLRRLEREGVLVMEG